jgi:ribosomal protein S1
MRELKKALFEELQIGDVVVVVCQHFGNIDAGIVVYIGKGGLTIEGLLDGKESSVHRLNNIFYILQEEE